MINIVIVDDEENALSLLKKLVETYLEDVCVVGTASTYKDALFVIESKKPDLLFLDVEIPGSTGIKIASVLTHKPLIVFVTAYVHYAIKALKVGAFDYLLKPVDLDELMACFEKAKKELNSPSTPTNNNQNKGEILPISVKDGILYINQSDTIWVKADGSYCQICTTTEKHLVSKNLKEISEMISADGFFRCHASYLIHLKHVVKFIKTDGYFAQMSDGTKVEISRRYKDEFTELMKSR